MPMCSDKHQEITFEGLNETACPMCILMKEHNIDLEKSAEGSDEQIVGLESDIDELTDKNTELEEKLRLVETQLEEAQST